MDVVLEAPITYEVSGGRVHSPLVTGRVGDEPTLFVLDTGASDHVLSVDLTEKVGLALSPAEPGTDVSGASVESWTVGNVETEIGGTRVELQKCFAIAGPEVFRSWGIGGILSPQALYPSGWVILDLDSDLLRVLRGREGSGWEDVRGSHEGRPCLELTRSAGILTAPVALEPHATVSGILDSGAPDTEFSRLAARGVAGLESDSGAGVGGVRVTAGRLGPATIAIGETRIPVSSLSCRESIPAPEGLEPAPRALLGMDLMRGTVVVLAPGSDGRAWWLLCHG